MSLRTHTHTLKGGYVETDGVPGHSVQIVLSVIWTLALGDMQLFMLQPQISTAVAVSVFILNWPVCIRIHELLSGLDLWCIDHLSVL